MLIKAFVDIHNFPKEGYVSLNVYIPSLSNEKAELEKARKYSKIDLEVDLNSFVSSCNGVRIYGFDVEFMNNRPYLVNIKQNSKNPKYTSTGDEEIWKEIPIIHYGL